MSRKRPDWDDYFLEIAKVVARRATCDRGKSGCVIARDHRILTTGYVGSPSGLPHCDDVGHLFKRTIGEDGRETKHCIRTIHAEQNALTQAALYGVSISGATLYCTMTPCLTCAMLIINGGIRRVICEQKYHVAGPSEELFLQAKIPLEYKSQSILHYENQ